ncbi:MAG: sigma-54-dependent Fis family transcriptional regulator [Bacteroidetes bacterium GWF2_33_16]|nr:MAG: sigma-54-dependent Fis family transcriptional regulator [Bacteroidetes bacterium GWE2_32_14]OFY03846.1 MAG: sigma-54-dependent Fis family transcriptional regulator [Bacteroidetes bacterium GWF2_33_16]
MTKIKGAILVIDDDLDVLTTCRMVLKQVFSNIDIVSDPAFIPTILNDNSYDVIILDMNFKPGVTDGTEGLFWLKRILTLDSNASVLMNTAYGDIKLAVEAMKIGAVDFIVKPWDSEVFIATVKSAFNLSQSKKKIYQLENTQKILSKDSNREFSEIISKSKSMKPVFSSIEKVSKTDANVIIFGENGTGKELIAREIHRKSNRANKPFINVDLGSLTESLFESELFGHTKGAFTDAKEDKPGRFEIASEGTLFLDEIGNLPLNLQSKLLSVIQNRVITRVGSNREIKIDIRLICATNRDLYFMTENGEFRQDLLYRINTVEINLPPLRSRSDDIPLLADYFLNKFCLKYNKRGLKIVSDGYIALKEYLWPGNIRELQHLIERAVIMSEDKFLTENDFVLKKSSENYTTKSLNIDELEKQAIINALNKCNRNFSKASEELGFGRSTLYRKMKKYGI